MRYLLLLLPFLATAASRADDTESPLLASALEKAGDNREQIAKANVLPWTLTLVGMGLLGFAFFAPSRATISKSTRKPRDGNPLSLGNDWVMIGA